MKAAINLSITNEDGSPFFDNTLAYSNMSRQDVVELEGLLLGFMKVLHDVGVEKAKEKPNKK